MNKKTLPFGINPENKKKDNWLKWFVITIPALIVVYIVSYALQWVFWKWIWLAIPTWVIFYFIDRKFGVMRHQSRSLIPKEIKKELEFDEVKNWMRKYKK